MPRKTATRNPRQGAVNLLKQIRTHARAGRFGQALELARHLHFTSPSEETQTVLQEATIGMANSLVRADRVGDLRKLLDDAERLNLDSQDWLEKIALFRARAGDWPAASRLLQRVPGTNLLPTALGHVADRALREPKNGKPMLPPEHHAGLDAIVTAFKHYEHGDDEAARNALQPIGMQSPFLDWKLLLRGLIAYSTNDDQRAIENWQRLDPVRLPAQLAGPLRFPIDSSFRAQVPSEQAKRLADRSDHLALPMLASLRKIQRLLSSPENLPDALHQVRPLIGMLKMNSPQHFQKLANCFYWLIIMGGEPDDMAEFEAVFGKPPDDPHFNRLVGLVMESSGRLDQAHKEWKQYSDWIAKQPQRFPGVFGKRARAILALRMGDNAVEYEQSDDRFSPFGFLDFFERQLNGRGDKKPLKPSAEACYRSALELAPDWKEPHSRLLDYYAEEEQWEKAEEIGRKLTERFPDDSQALIDFSEILHTLGKDAEALESLRTALRHNPLDNNLRGVVAQMTLRNGRLQAMVGEFAAARESFQESLKLDPDVMATATRASWAACEFKAQCETEARRLIAELLEMPQRRVAAAFLLLAETSRIKAPKPVVAEFKAQFEESLRGDVGIQEFLHLLMACSLYRSEEDRYHGFGTHEKKIYAKVEGMLDGGIPENDLARLGIMLAEMGLAKPLKVLADRGRLRYAQNPAFVFLQSQQLMLQRPKSFDIYRVGSMIAQVLASIEAKNEPIYVAIRSLIDRRCEEHPRLREVIERQREYMKDSPQYGRML